MIVDGLRPGINVSDIPVVYDICLVPMMSSDDLGAGAGCGICVQSDDADLSSGCIKWYPEMEQSRVIPDHLSSPALIGLTIAAIANEVEKAQQAGSTIFLIQVPDKDGQPDNAMAYRLAEIARQRIQRKRNIDSL